MGEFMTGPFFLSEVPPYHGEDGFGDADLPPIDARLESEHAVMAIIKLAELYKGSLRVIFSLANLWEFIYGEFQEG